jgi:hypothetical protein
MTHVLAFWAGLAIGFTVGWVFAAQKWWGRIADGWAELTKAQEQAFRDEVELHRRLKAADKALDQATRLRGLWRERWDKQVDLRS